MVFMVTDYSLFSPVIHNVNLSYWSALFSAAEFFFTSKDVGVSNNKALLFVIGNA